MSRILTALLTAIVLCCTAGPSSQLIAQTAPTADAAHTAQALPDTTQREFRFLSTNKIGTMEKELNTLAAQGFRLERVSKTMYNGNVAALATRDAAATDAARYEYKLLATRRSGTMEKELAEASGQGFEVRGMTQIMRPGIAYIAGDETIVALERKTGETARRYEYKLLSTGNESKMQKQLDEAVAAGYTPIEMVRNLETNAAAILIGPRAVFSIILARPTDNSAANAATREYKFLATTKVGTMQREMNQAAKLGYRLYRAAPEMLTLMARARGAKEAATYEYKLLATMKTGTMQKELYEQVEQGYNYVATSDGLGGLTIVLERGLTAESKANRRELKLLATTREEKTQKEIAESLAAGYHILDLTSIGEFIIVLDRPRADAPADVH